MFGFAPPLLAATAGSLLLAGAFLALSRFTVFAWATAGAAAVTCAAAAAAWAPAASVGLLPVILLIPVGSLLEGRGRAAWAQPFHLVGLTALLVAPILLMGQGAVAGLAPHVDPSLGLLALHGAGMVAAAVAMRRFGGLDLRLAARVLEPVAALYLVGILGWNACAAAAPAAGGARGLGAAFLSLARGRIALFAPAALGIATALLFFVIRS